jgi:large subunit ribosomal protein L30
MSQDNQNPSLSIKLKKSPIGFEKSQKATVAALGLRRVGAVVNLPANDSVRGMVFKVKHLLEVKESA